MDATELRKSAVEAINDGRLDVARPLWSRLCESEPLDAENWLILAAIDENLGFLPAALGHLRYAFHLAPDDPEVWLKAADIKWRMQQYDAAVADACQALALDFANPELRIKVASWLVAGHRFSRAAPHFAYLCAAGLPIGDDALVEGLCCAWLGGDDALLARLLDRTDGAGHANLADAVTRRARDLGGPERAGQSGDAEPRSGSVAAFLGLLEHRRAGGSGGDQTALLDARAHTEDWTTGGAERSTMAALARLAARLGGGGTALVVEIGCGTGRLGQYIKHQWPDAVLAGTDPSSPALERANRKNDYDNLVQWPGPGEPVVDLPGGPRIIIVGHRTRFYVDRCDLLEQVIGSKDKAAAVIVTFSPDDDDRQRITALISSAGLPHRWRTLNPWPDEWLALVIAPPGHVDTAGAVRTSRNERIEHAGNLLINADRLLAAGRYEDAERAAGEVLEVFPGSARALYVSGVGRQHQKDFVGALRLYRRALATFRGFADCLFQVGTVYQQRGRAGRARRAYEACLRFAPAHIAASNNLVLLLLAAGDRSAAFGRLTQRLANQPLNDAFVDQAKALVEQAGGGELDTQLDNFLSSAKWLEASFNAALNSRYFQRCEGLLNKLEQSGEDVDLDFLRVRLLEKKGQLRTARRRLDAMLAADPDKLVYIQSRAGICAAQGLPGQAWRQWLKASRLGAATDANLQNMLFYSNYCHFLKGRTLFRHHRRWGRRLSAALRDKRLPARAVERGPKIRIGYVSGDFRMHSVALFFYNILKFHDRERFTVYCYSSTPAEDMMTTKLRLFSDCWRQIQHVGDDDVANLIRRDRIDILVDLAGHTASNRVPVFCRRPAPVQCTYLGYANTTGLEEIDYRITDSDADPGGMTEHLHTERLVRLPSGFLSYSRHFGSSPVTVRRGDEPRRRYTFACCNNVYKVNEAVIAAWSEILERLPGTNLLIKAHNLDNAEILARYRGLFERNGIDSDRVHLMNTIDISEHQNLYNDVDIALDPFPYNGTTTTCDALWMGVPVLSQAGTRHAGRVGVSILTRVGLTDWIARDEHDYVDKAVRFANDREVLANLKLSMRERMLNSPLMRPGAVTRDLEAAFEAMIEDTIE